MMKSLRHRAIVGGLIWASVSIAIGGIALFSFFDRLAQNRFNASLLERHLQVVVALSNSGGDSDLMDSFLPDAAYQRPYSGRYWQVTDSQNNTTASRSLFDSLIAEHADVTHETQLWTEAGPGENIRLAQKIVTLENGTDWIVTVAESLFTLDSESQQIRQSLMATFALIGALGIAGAFLQISTIVRPLTKLREDVANRWKDEQGLNPADYPEEVAPLVVDINTLLDRNREIVSRARRRAADLAHALKTPTAILRNELDALDQKNIDVTQAQDALTRVDAQLSRSLARIRAANSGATTSANNDITTSVDRLARLFRSMPISESKNLKLDLEPGLKVRMDVQDLEEILGNILENAFRWCHQNVRVSSRNAAGHITLSIEDDGPGIPGSDRREALRSGGRLDTSTPGTGLGLAIAADLLQAYGGSIELTHSDLLGGLRVSMQL